MAVELIEKRHFQRIPLTLAVSGKCPGKPFRGLKFQGEIRDASFEGLCMKVPNSHFFKEGQQVNLKARLYEGDFFIKFKGIICWVRAQNNNSRPVSMGVKLTGFKRFGLWCEKIENQIAKA